MKDVPAKPEPTVAVQMVELQPKVLDTKDATATTLHMVAVQTGVSPTDQTKKDAQKDLDWTPTSTPKFAHCQRNKDPQETSQLNGSLIYPTEPAPVSGTEVQKGMGIGS